jgi:hypothetical protein
MQTKACTTNTDPMQNERLVAPGGPFDMRVARKKQTIVTLSVCDGPLIISEIDIPVAKLPALISALRAVGIQ